jgi:hypothetical protein
MNNKNINEIIYATVIHQLEELELEGSISPKERIDLICRLLPYITVKKSNRDEINATLEDIDPLEKILN